MKTLRRVLGVLLIFFFGVFIGAAVTGAGFTKKVRETVMGGPEAVMEVIVKRLDSELKLDAEQKRRVQSVMDEAHIRLRQSRAKIQPDVEATLLDAETRVRALLYPKQIARFDELVSKGREQWKAKEGVAMLPATPAAQTPPPVEEPR